MRVHIGTDHAAFELKEFLVDKLTEAGYDVVDHGANTYQELDDYPDYCIPAAEGAVADFANGGLGIVLGGSGNGEQMAANKVAGCRAALCWAPELARLAREHNNAVVCSLPGRFVTEDQAWEIVKTFLETPFSAGERHARRIHKMTDYENG